MWDNTCLGCRALGLGLTVAIGHAPPVKVAGLPRAHKRLSPTRRLASTSAIVRRLGGSDRQSPATERGRAVDLESGHQLLI